MTITVNVHDVALQEDGTISASSLINSLTADSDSDAFTEWDFSTTDGGHFNLNGVPQDPNGFFGVPAAQLDEVTYTAGPNPGPQHIKISAYDATFDTISVGGDLTVQIIPLGGVPIIDGTASNDVFHFGGNTQGYVGEGGHDEVFIAVQSVNYVFKPLSDGMTVLLQPDGKAPELTLANVEEVKFIDKTDFVENSDNANIARLYSAAFDRVPDADGLFFWEDIYAKDVSAAAKAAGYYIALAQTNDGSGTSIAGGFMRSSEFTNRYGTLTDANFVNQLYLNVLGRPADTAGLNFWIDQIEHQGQTREVVLVGFAESPENVAKTSAAWLIQTG